MTVLNHYSGIGEIVERLTAVQSRRRAVRIASGVLAAATIMMASLLIVSALGYWPGQPPPAARWVILTGLCLLWLAAVWCVARAFLWRQNPAQTARFVEQANPDIRNDLINSVLLADDRQQASSVLVAQAIRETAWRAMHIDLLSSISLRPMKRWALAAGMVAAMLAAMAIFQGGRLSRGLLAVFAPRSYIPTKGDVELISLNPGDVTIFAGEPLTISASIRNDAGRPYSGRFIVEGEETPRKMLMSRRNTTFTLHMSRVDQSFNYAVSAGDSRWPVEAPYYKVTVLKRVEVEAIKVRYDYPAYTRLASRTIPFIGHIEAPIGTRAEITARLTAPVPTVVLDVVGDAPRAMNALPDSRNFSAVIPVNRDGAYRLVVKDLRGRTLQQLPDNSNSETIKDAYSPDGQSLMAGYFYIRAIPDKPPKVTFLAPNRDVAVSPGESVEMKIGAWDDYGLTRCRLWVGPEGDQPKVVEDFSAALLTSKPQLQATHTFSLTDYKENDVIVYYATATDNRNLSSIGPRQTAESTKFKIIVQKADKVTAEEASLWTRLHQRLMDILKLQESQRVNTEICRTVYKTVNEVRATGSEILRAQRKIRADLIELAENFPFTAGMASIQQALVLLSDNEAQLAIQQSQVLAGLAELGKPRQNACHMLIGTQNRIINALGMLLAIIPSLQMSSPGEMQAASKADLPSEVRQRMEQFAEDLHKFIDDELKVIQASERLVKKPADNFTTGDEKLLGELQAAQDKWEKFINEAFTDFYTLTTQDFSNPVLLKELMSIKSDVTMAADALSKKAVEIATAIEENVVENAETLTANLEKWLSDEPDRAKWSMEEPMGQENIEAPELPSELEDLVGDLLEEEEDLFDEMDDISSKYATSGDVGIGWDAKDGPISSMNAQGVTGNQLPNTSEISGRSGEGREGKSTGEFVQDTAIGKGGRRTPTRLTPEPFMRGQVKDTSQEPPGGATGGGKLSGSGAEGLEGPVPPPLAKELQRLAGRQAQLTNRAERLQSSFKVGDYSNFKFLQAIVLMNRVRGDLERYRYRNALRSRDSTLEKLRETRMLLSGQINVATDSSAGMPKYIRDNIADAMGGKLPDEFRHALEHYYRRLSTQSR